MSCLSITSVVVALLAVVIYFRMVPDIPVEDLIPEYGAERDGSLFVDVGGVAVHCRCDASVDGGAVRGGACFRADAAETVLLIHGTSSSLHTWDGWTAELTQRVPSIRVLRATLPGFGLTGPHHRAPAGYSINAYADLMHDFLAEVFQGSPPTVSVAGNSLGGHVAWKLASRHPSVVRRLALLGASGGFPRDQRLPLVFQLGQVPVANKLLRWITPRYLVAANLNQVYSNASLITPELVDRHWQLLLRAGNRQALIDRLSEVAKEMVAPEADKVAELAVPSLVLWGADDRWVSTTHGQKYAAAIKDAEWVSMPGLGHVLQEEDPKGTADVFIDFMQRR